jgi:hypothetical protein
VWVNGEIEMRAGLAGLVLAGLLLGCGRAEMAQDASGGAAGNYAPTEESAPMADMDMQTATRAVAPEAPSPAPPPPPPPGQPPAPTPTGGTASPVLFLAYAYSVRMELPADRLAGVMDAHVQACQQAGPRVCQLIGSTRSGEPESQMYGTVQLRAEPVWLRGLMGSLSGQVDEAGGKILEQATSTEDLTRAIVDTEARLRATRALRDRLQRLLESRPGRLSDLLEVERELARVQGEIDATESNLAVMRTRVSMSELTLGYSSAPQSLRSDTFRPLTDALAGFVGWIVIGIASIITIIAVLLPWLLVAGLFAWLALKWRRRNGGRFWKRRATPAPEAPPPAQGA